MVSQQQLICNDFFLSAFQLQMSRVSANYFSATSNSILFMRLRLYFYDNTLPVLIVKQNFRYHKKTVLRQLPFLILFVLSMPRVPPSVLLGIAFYTLLQQSNRQTFFLDIGSSNALSLLLLFW